MSPKELLYIDDALSHEQYLICQCSDVESRLQDASLKQLVGNLKSKHQNLWDQLYNLI
ncbi:MAG: hypothetical protein LUH02_01035 [Erysipelotrichaceae bacterium]|nr:hypothetical protein [Erysipelotrichaceae bacterium]